LENAKKSAFEKKAEAEPIAKSAKFSGDVEMDVDALTANPKMAAAAKSVRFVRSVVVSMYIYN
jgi:hypothetical protein